MFVNLTKGKSVTVFQKNSSKTTCRKVWGCLENVLFSRHKNGRKMNKRSIIFSLLFLVCGFLLTSCNDDSDDWDASALVGQWWSVDDDYDVICLEFYRNGTGICTEDSYYNGYTEDYFDWFVEHRLIHVIFEDGSRWCWDYSLYDGHTVEINGRVFSRDPYYPYYSRRYINEEKTFN